MTLHNDNDPLNDPFGDAELGDAELDALLRDARRTYNAPTELPQTEAMWSAVERSLAEQAEPSRPSERQLKIVHDVVPPRIDRRWWQSPWLRSAAVLLLGVAIGRGSTRGPAADTPAVVAAAPSDSLAVSPADQVATSDYLDRTQALLAALPSELHARRADPAYLSRADALLLQTRLLLDSPAASDPALRSLFDDLELVLAQVVRLQGRGRHDPTQIDFLNQALEQRDVLPRLRDAVADNAANAAD